jgi:hypothetical protein
MTTRDIISDCEIDRIHLNANFGSMSKRRVVDEGVLKYAVGYTGGSTQLSILQEHGLVHRPRIRSCRTTLTGKGQKYLQAMIGDNWTAIADYLCDGGWGVV